jgi:hypothetical protein
MSQLRLRFLQLLSHKRTKHLGLGFLALIILVMIASALFLPSFVKSLVIEQTQQTIGRQLEIAEIGFSPLTLTLTARGVNLLENDQKTAMLKLKKAELSLSIASLFRGALVMDEVQIEEPSFHIVRTSADGYGRYNFSDILDRIAAMPKSAAPFRFSLSNIQIQDGSIRFDDLVLEKHIQIDTLKLGLPFLSNFPSSTNSFVQPHLSAKINGAPFALTGRSKPFVDSLETSLAIDIDHLDLPSYIAYLPFPLPAKLQSAKLSTKLDLVFDRKNRQAELLLSGDVRIDSLSVQNKSDKALLKMNNIVAHLKQLNVITAATNIDKLNVDAPEIWLDLDANGQSNWSELIDFFEVKPIDPPPAATKLSTDLTAKPVVSMGEFVLNHGKINFSDAFHATPVQRLQISDINLNAKRISTAINSKPGLVSLEGHIEGNQALRFTGEYSANNRDLVGKVSMEALQMARFQEVFNRYLAAKINGVVSIESQLSMRQGQLKLNETGLKISDLSIIPNAKSAGKIAVKTLQIEKLDLDTQTRLVHASGLTIVKMDADIRRDEDSKFSLLKMVVANTTSGSLSPTRPVLKNGQETQATDWIVNLQNFSLNESNFSFEDHAVSPFVRTKVQDVSLSAENLSSDLSQAINMKWMSTVNRKGKLSLVASATPKLQKISVDVDGKSLPVSSFYPYFSHLLNVEVLHGNANVKGTVQLNINERNALESGFEGTLSLNDFQLSENGGAEDFLNWKSITFDGIKFGFSDTKKFIFLRKLGMSDFYAKFILSEKGTLNIGDILVKNEVDPAETQHSAEQASFMVVPKAAMNSTSLNPIEIKIGQTNFTGGNIDFRDNYIKPNYRANLTGVGGSIGTISSINTEAASMQLSGKIDDDAPLLISGTVNPLSTPIFIDIKGSASDVQLTRLSQYATKYAGYPIVKGHLSVEVAYHVENQILAAENNLKLDQLTLGERIVGPSETTLPVNFALALLRDNDGRIAIDLPISGSLSDPQFSLGKIIFRVFSNIITKAVTAPFALISSMFGAGEELAFGEFSPGSAELTQATIAKLDSLANALKARTKLKLDITGRVDPLTDAEGLRLVSVDSKIKFAKLRELRKKNPTIQAHEVGVDETDRKTYIEEVYSAGKFAKQRNLIGIAKTLPPQDALNIVLRNTAISSDDLRALAQQRAEIVLDYMEQQGGIAKDRLFLIAPKLDGEGINDNGRASRVDFSLK